MLTFLNKIRFDISNCQQCGTCIGSCPVNAISASINKKGLNDILIDAEKCTSCLKCVKSCPANKKETSNGILESLAHKHYFLAYNKDEEIRHNASSGGVARTLLINGLQSGTIDGAYTLKRSTPYPYCEGEYYHKQNLPEYNHIPNSVYHPTFVNQNLNKISKTNRLMVIGTSCQLKGLVHTLKGKYNELIKVCIFCKQQKTFESTQFLAKILGTKISIKHPFTFNYRGNGWPGIVKINYSELEWDVAAKIPFGRRLWTVPGCNVCSNPFGENVDITLLDPWGIEKTNKLGKTLTITHTKAGEELLKGIPSIILEKKNYSQIEEALMLKDIKRKQQLVPFFKGERCGNKIRLAGNLELFQRWYFTILIKSLPRMPILIYKILNKIPDLRNIILH